MTDTIKFHKMINGELVPIELKRQRFEQTVERIDHDVDRGASKSQILATYKDYIVSSGAAAKPASEPSGDAELKPKEKQEIVRQAIEANPSMTVGEIIKHVTAHHEMSAANVRYIATKLMK